MLRQKSQRRLLCAAAFAAAPIGAHAAPIVMSPLPECSLGIGSKTDGSYLDAIRWRSGQDVKGNGTTIDATVSGVSMTKLTPSYPYSAPFQCTKAAPVFATVDLTRGDAFSIDFGPLYTAPTKFFPGGSSVDYTPVFTSGEYRLPITKLFTSGAIVTDFNLYLDATSARTGELLYKDFLGVQVISSESAISPSNAFYFSSSATGIKSTGGPQDLIFDPPFPGSARVNLLSSPDPRLPAVPEPGTFALMGAGLAGLLGFWRRRRKVAEGGEPGD